MRGRLWPLLAVLAIVLVAGLIVAPRFRARSMDGNGGDTAITFKFPEQLAAPVEQLVAAFHREFPDLRVNAVGVPGTPVERRQTLEEEMAALAAVETDLFAVELSWLPAWHDAGWARNLEPLGADQLAESFLDQAFAPAWFSNGTYGLPWILEPSFLYYRRDLIEAAGLDPPQSWDDLVRLSTSFMDNGAVQWGFVWAGVPAEALARLFLELVWANGGDLMEDGEVAVARAPAREALHFLRDLIHNYRISPQDATDWSQEEVRQSFQAGNALLLRHPPALWQTPVERETAAEQWGVALLPAGPRGADAVASIDGWALVIHPETPRLEAAWTFARWLTGQEAQRILAQETGRLPALAAPYHEPDAPEKQPFFSTMYTRVTASGRPVPAFVQWPAMADAMARRVQQALTGPLTPDEALDRLAADLETLIPPEAGRAQRDTPIGLQRRDED